MDTNYNSKNNESFSWFVKLFYDEIYSFTYRQVIDINIAQDLTQEIFIKAYQNIQKYDSSKSSHRTWLYRIASNHLINYYKKKKIDVTPLNLNIQTNDIDFTILVERKEQIKYLIKVINETLSKKQKKIIHLHFFSDLSVKEISECLLIPKQTVYSSLSRSIENIKEVVRKDGFY